MKDKMFSYMFMTLTSIFWAGAFIGGKIGVLQLSPVSLTFLRLFFASVIVILLALKIDRNCLKIHIDDLGIIVLLALIGVVGYQILLYTALRYTSSSNASILVSLSPLITAGLAYYVHHEQISIKMILPIILAIVGVVLTISNWNINTILAMSFNKGDIIMLIATISLALYSIIVKSVVKRYTPLFITTYTLIISTIILIPFSLREGILNKVNHLSIQTWGSVLYLALFPSVIAYILQQKSIDRIGPVKTEVFRNLIPVFSLFLSYIFLGEQVTLLKIISSSLIIIAVLMNINIKFNYRRSIPKKGAIKIN